MFEMLMIFQDKGQTVCLINDEVKKPKENPKSHEEIFYSVIIYKYSERLIFKLLEKRFDC